MLNWNNNTTRKEEKHNSLMLNLNIMEHCIVRLHSSCGTDLGRSTEVVTDNIHSIGVVKPVYGIPT